MMVIGMNLLCSWTEVDFLVFSKLDFSHTVFLYVLFLKVKIQQR